MTLADSFGRPLQISLTPFRQLAFATTIGILVDAFLVRSLPFLDRLILMGRASGFPGPAFNVRLTKGIVRWRHLVGRQVRAVGEAHVFCGESSRGASFAHTSPGLSTDLVVPAPIGVDARPPGLDVGAHWPGLRTGSVRLPGGGAPAFSHHWVVVSGFAERAQWYQNLLAHPVRAVSTAALIRRPATAHVLDSAQAASVLSDYRLEHPLAWNQLRDTIERATGRPITTLPMIELTLLA